MAQEFDDILQDLLFLLLYSSLLSGKLAAESMPDPLVSPGHVLPAKNAKNDIS